MATRQIATEIVLGGEKEFNSAMTAINSNLKTLRTDMAATSAEFDGNADSIDALTAKQKILAETAAQNDAKVDALRQRYEHLKATLGEDAAATDKAKQALNQAIVAQQKAAKAAKENADALEAAQKAAREEAAAQEAANKSASAYTPVTQKAARRGQNVRKLPESVREQSQGIGHRSQGCRPPCARSGRGAGRCGCRRKGGKGRPARRRDGR